MLSKRASLGWPSVRAGIDKRAMAALAAGAAVSRRRLTLVLVGVAAFTMLRIDVAHWTQNPLPDRQAARLIDEARTSGSRPCVFPLIRGSLLGYTRGPDEVGGTTIRIELFVDDPRAAYEQAIAAGCRPGNAPVEHEHTLVDGGTLRMLQGGVIDPFGHVWLIGRFLDQQ